MSEASILPFPDGRFWENYRILEAQEGWPLTRSHCYPSLAFLNGNAHMTYWETHRHTAVERLFHLIYRRLPLSWFYENAERRPPLHDMKRIIRRVYYPDTVFDGERRRRQT